jgi:acyl-CoA synthetase (AMP-forming)/AMP-acid ligase II
MADERMGEVGKAYVVLRPGAETPSEAELIAWSRQNMANFKVPRAFTILPDLPRNAAGKVLKTELRSPLPRPLD